MGANIVEQVNFRGQRKVPQDTLRALIFTKKGDVYDPADVSRDFMALWNTGRFDDLVVRERDWPARRRGAYVRGDGAAYGSHNRLHGQQIDQQIGNSGSFQRAAREPDVRNRSYDPGKVQHAKNVLQDYEAERGHQYATVTPQIRQVPPGGVDVTFAIDEGPKVKVGNIIIQGNKAFSRRDGDSRDEEPEADRHSALAAF